MGLPMANNLLKRMDDDTTFYVYDVVQESIDNFVDAGKERIKACASSKEVADKSVRHAHINIRYPHYLLCCEKTMFSRAYADLG